MMDEHQQQRLILGVVWFIILIALFSAMNYYENLADEYNHKAQEADEFEEREEYRDLQIESETKQGGYGLAFGLWLVFIPLVFLAFDAWLVNIRGINR